jgi:DNA-binding MarR family transcriptional regulator
MSRNAWYGRPVATDRQLLLLWSNLYHLNRAIRSALSRSLDGEGGCSLLEHDLMSWLEVSGAGRPRMQDLADLLDITPGGVTRLVDRLVARGWVIREQLPGNRVQTYASLTPAGTAALRRARTAYLKTLRETLPAGMPADDLADLTARTTDLLAELTRADQGDIKHLPGVHRPASARAHNN